MPAAAVDLGMSLRMEVAQLRADLDQARAVMKQTRGDFRSHAEGIRESIEGLRHPLRAVSEATRGLGAAFGGMKSEAVQAGREILLGFGGAGGLGIAIAGLALLVSKVTEAYAEEGAAAKKASQDASTAQAAEIKNRKEILQTLRDEVRLNLLKLQGKDPAVETAKDTVSQASFKAAEAQRRLNDINDQISLAKEQGKKLADEARAKIDQGGGVLLVGSADVDTTAANITDLVAQQKKATDDVVFYTTQASLAQIAGDEKVAVDKHEQDKNDEKDYKHTLEEKLRAFNEMEQFKLTTHYQNQKKEEDFDRARQKEHDKEVFADFIRAVDDFDRQQNRIKEGLAGVGSFAQDIGQTLTQFIVAPLKDGFNGMADLVNMLKDLLVGLIEKLVAAAIAAAILSALTGGATSFGAAFGATSGITGLLNSVSAAGGHAEGGMISGPGSGTSDSIIARLSAGEYVMPAAAVQKWGVGFMDQVASRGYAGGGLVGGGAPGGNTYITQNVMAFDAPAIDRGASRFENSETKRFDNRQGQVYQQRIRNGVG